MLLTIHIKSVYLFVQSNHLYLNIYKITGKIPCGKVATYGQIARLAGLGKNARVVGYALSALPQQTDLPWHRVINRLGKISYSPSRNDHDNLQKQLLISEGVEFSSSDSINLNIFLWNE